MKTKVYFLILFATMSFVSCESNSNNSDGTNNDNTETTQQATAQQTTKKSFPDSLVYVTKTYDRVFPECEGDNCTTYQLTYIEMADKAYAFINDSVKVGLIGKHSSMDDAADEFFDQYSEDAGDSQMHWMKEVNTGVDFNQNGLFTVSYGYYSYMGGAHGMPGYSSTNYDLATNKALKLYDLINKANSSELLTLGEQYFRKDNRLTATDNLNENGYFDGEKFRLSDVFTITKTGLTFSYSAYEIGPYALGMPEFTIPYSELKPYLAENSPLKRFVK